MQVALETLGFNEELRLHVEAVEDTGRVMRVQGRDQLAAYVADGHQVTWGYEAGGADQGKTGSGNRHVAQLALSDLAVKYLFHETAHVERNFILQVD